MGKHGVDFADAVGVLEDEWALSVKDKQVDGEQRFATLGVDFLERVLVVVYTHRGGTIRKISARRATRRERRAYEQKRVLLRGSGTGGSNKTSIWKNPDYDSD